MGGVLFYSGRFSLRLVFCLVVFWTVLAGGGDSVVVLLASIDGPFAEVFKAEEEPGVHWRYNSGWRDRGTNENA